MNVICIVNKEFWLRDNPPILPKRFPEFGEKYSVSDEKKYFGTVYYRILELDYRFGYDAEGFIPSSDIDEVEMERNYKKEVELI